MSFWLSLGNLQLSKIYLSYGKFKIFRCKYLKKVVLIIYANNVSDKTILFYAIALLFLSKQKKIKERKLDVSEKRAEMSVKIS